MPEKNQKEPSIEVHSFDFTQFIGEFFMQTTSVTAWKWFFSARSITPPSSSDSEILMSRAGSSDSTFFGEITRLM